METKTKDVKHSLKAIYDYVFEVYVKEMNKHPETGEQCYCEYNDAVDMVDDILSRVKSLNYKTNKDIADSIVNTINTEFNLQLLTIDSFAMSETIIGILHQQTASKDAEIAELKAKLGEKEKQWRYEKERRDAAEILCGEYSNNFAPITDDGEDYVKWHEANDLWRFLVSQEQGIYKTKKVIKRISTPIDYLLSKVVNWRCTKCGKKAGTCDC